MVQAHELQALPAEPATIAAFLVDEAERGIAASTIGRRVAAIRYAHKLAEHPDPTGHPDVTETLKGIRRRLGTAREGKAPATAEVVTRMLAHVPAGLAGQRDRAILTLGFSAALRRSELVALDVADLVLDREGLRLMIRRSKTDQEGAGQEIAVPHGRHLKPVEAVHVWLAAAGITEGPVFRPVTRAGTVRNARLTDQSIANIVKRYATAAGRGLGPPRAGGRRFLSSWPRSCAPQGEGRHRAASPEVNALARQGGQDGPPVTIRKPVPRQKLGKGNVCADGRVLLENKARVRQERPPGNRVALQARLLLHAAQT